MQTSILKPPTEIVNLNFQQLLNEFYSLLGKNSPKEEFIKLRETAKLKILTERQKEAIVERCNNVVSGNYGSTSKAPDKSFKR